MDYYYLVSSLPGLAFGAALPLTEAAFCARCREYLTAGDQELLMAATLVPDECTCLRRDVAGSYARWETNLRNLAARARAGVEATKYLRAEHDYFAEQQAIIQEASSRNTMLEKEQILDQARWRKLDDLAAGNWAGIEALVAYKLHLAILAKYQSRNVEAGNRGFAGLLDTASPKNDVQITK